MLTSESFERLIELLDDLPAASTTPEWDIEKDGGWNVGMELQLENRKVFPIIAMLSNAINSYDKREDLLFFPNALCVGGVMIGWLIQCTNPEVTPDMVADKIAATMKRWFADCDPPDPLRR